MASNNTAQAFHLLWDNPLSRQALLDAFLERVTARATRRDIDELLEHLDTTLPGMALVLRGVGVDLAQVQWRRLTDFLCDCFYAIQGRDPSPSPPADAAWDRAEGEVGVKVLYPDRDRIIRRSVPLHLLPLERLLLNRAQDYGQKAERMVYRGEEWDLEQLLARGQVFSGPVAMREGEPGQAHSNAAQLWADHREQFSLVTGYGLSEDGLWRQHSWILRTNPRPHEPLLIETTVARVLYFGYVLTQEEAERFYQANS